MSRENGRRPDSLRPLTIEADYLENPHGSALITCGRTKVLCTAMVAEEVPRWLRNQGGTPSSIVAVQRTTVRPCA